MGPILATRGQEVQARERVRATHRIALGEHHENDMRKAFTVSGRVTIGKKVETWLGNRRGRRTDGLPEIIPEVAAGTEAREVAAERAGFGNARTCEQAKTVIEGGTPELAARVDERKVSDSAAAEVGIVFENSDSHRERRSSMRISVLVADREQLT
jgi:hypothetical protein